MNITSKCGRARRPKSVTREGHTGYEAELDLRHQRHQRPDFAKVSSKMSYCVLRAADPEAAGFLLVSLLDEGKLHLVFFSLFIYFF